MIAPILALLAFSCPQAAAEARSTVLSQSYDRFDATPHDGWRPLGETQHCFSEAGDLIRFYLMYKPGLTVSQQVHLYFHAGQVYAFAGETELALDAFCNAVHDPAATPDFKWSEYVLATMAFLQRDIEATWKYRDLLAAGPKMPANEVNLHVVDRLIENFNSGYKDAY